MKKRYTVTGTIRQRYKEKYCLIEESARTDSPGKARAAVETRLGIERKSTRRDARVWLTEPLVVESSVVAQMRVRGEPMLWDSLAEWYGGGEHKDSPVQLRKQ